MPTKSTKSAAPTSTSADTYKHKDSELCLRPDVGTQTRFKRKKPPKTYRYDSSLAPSMNWDGQNSAREYGEWLLGIVEELAHAGGQHSFKEPRFFSYANGEQEGPVWNLTDAVTRLKALSQPFLEWAGKAERLSFDVPTLPLFVHEQLSTKAIIETLKTHRKDKGQIQRSFMDYFGGPQLSVRDQILGAYEYKNAWENRMILGDSLVVMNSLLEYEGMHGKVQMIYFDPPYGVKFSSNFQPFVRARDVKNSDDASMTREPEMVQAYRDTWEMGCHSYLTYLRDRILISKRLLNESGSIFVQISEDNLHHIKQILDEVFGENNFVSLVSFAKTSSSSGQLLSSTTDFILLYAKNIKYLKYRQLFVSKCMDNFNGSPYSRIELIDGTRRSMTQKEKSNPSLIPDGSKIYRIDNITSQRPAQGNDVSSYIFNGRTFSPGKGTFKTDKRGLDNLSKSKRLENTDSGLYYVRFLNDFPVNAIGNLWDDTVIAGFSSDKLYIVQTNTKVIERCLLMATDPGDLVLDPTCGSGTTAYIAEQWGRRWITIDTSRVPLALARQRLLTSTFPWYDLKDRERGPSGGFVYQQKQNKKGEEIGGIVPHVTLKSIANNEPPQEEILVDNPEINSKIVRVAGPFCVEATIPTPVDFDLDGEDDSSPQIAEDHGSFIERMLEVLRKSPILHLPGNATVELADIRVPAKTISLSAEAVIKDESSNLAAFVFGPEYGAISEKLVSAAAREAYQKGYHHLYVIGFAIEPNARTFIEACEELSSIPATYIQATPDLLMGDLLKNMRSSQIFSVCGLPDVEIKLLKDGRWQVQFNGLDTFDPVEMKSLHLKGDDVPAWFLDTDYNPDGCFHVCQAFFPRTSAWENLKKALKAEYDPSVWAHLAGTTSVPFEAGGHGRIAVKAIDMRGNELLVVKDLKAVKA